jgi:thioesterase domain-containing protein
MHYPVRGTRSKFPSGTGTETAPAAQGFDILVASALSRIVGAQPEGPILLAGYSYGEDVGFAVASRLVVLRRLVAGFAILDTAPVSRGDRCRTIRAEPFFAQLAADVLWLAREVSGVVAREVSGSLDLQDGGSDGPGTHSRRDPSDAFFRRAGPHGAV